MPENPYASPDSISAPQPPRHYRRAHWIASLPVCFGWGVIILFLRQHNGLAYEDGKLTMHFADETSVFSSSGRMVGPTAYFISTPWFTGFSMFLILILASLATVNLLVLGWRRRSSRI